MTLQDRAARRAELYEAWKAERAAVRGSRVRLSVRGYAVILSYLRDHPCTLTDLQCGLGISRMAAYRVVLSFHALRRVHIAGWEVKPYRPAMPIFKFGRGADADPPTLRPNGRPVERHSHPQERLCPSVAFFDRMLTALEEPMLRAELQEAVQMDKRTVAEGCTALVEFDLAHIAMWDLRETGGAPRPVYQVGEGKSAPKPPTKRLTRERQRELGARYRKQRGAKLLATALGINAPKEEPCTA